MPGWVLFLLGFVGGGCVGVLLMAIVCAGGEDRGRMLPP
jgi:hypothetical protein